MTERVRLTNDGLLGVRTAAPAYPLDVTGTANATSYRVGGTAGVSCATGTVVAATMVVINGIVTHC